MYLSVSCAGKHQNQPAESPGKEAVKWRPKGQRPSTTAKEPHGPRSLLAYQKPCLRAKKTGIHWLGVLLVAYFPTLRKQINPHGASVLKGFKRSHPFFESFKITFHSLESTGTRWTPHTRNDAHPRVIKSALCYTLIIHISNVWYADYSMYYIFTFNCTNTHRKEGPSFRNHFTGYLLQEWSHFVSKPCQTFKPAWVNAMATIPETRKVLFQAPLRFSTNDQLSNCRLSVLWSWGFKKSWPSKARSSSNPTTFSSRSPAAYQETNTMPSHYLG